MHSLVACIIAWGIFAVPGTGEVRESTHHYDRRTPVVAVYERNQGAVVNISGRREHKIITQARQVLMNLHHRGAAGSRRRGPPRTRGGGPQDERGDRGTEAGGAELEPPGEAIREIGGVAPLGSDDRGPEFVA